MSNIIIQYLQWHFNDQAKAILRAWKNFLIFGLNFCGKPSRRFLGLTYIRKQNLFKGRIKLY